MGPPGHVRVPPCRWVLPVVARMKRETFVPIEVTRDAYMLLSARLDALAGVVVDK